MKKLLCCLAFFCVSPALAQVSPSPSSPRTISVTGEASAQIAPDQAILSMSLISKDPALATAKAANDALVERLVVIARNYNIPKEKISTSSVTVSPEYNYNAGAQKFIGYIVSRSFRVTIDNLDNQERLLSAIIAAKIDQINGVDFILSEPEKYTADLRIKAFDQAKKRAEALAAAAGSKLGSPISIVTEGATQPPIARPMAMMADFRGKGADASVAPSLPGLISLHETVNVTFGLE